MLGNMNTFKLRRMLPLGLVFALGIGAIIGSTSGNRGSTMRPQILTFSYHVQQASKPVYIGDDHLGNPLYTPVADAIRSLSSGRLTFVQVMPQQSCLFLADFSVAQPPDITLNGNPGQVGANVTIKAADPKNSEANQNMTCGAVKELSIDIGSQGEPLILGTPTVRIGARLEIDGKSFDTSNGYFRASLDTFDARENYKVGHFEFIAPSSGDSMAFVTGTYAAR